MRLNADGSADEYVHRLTRVLSKEGIEQYGEAAPPAGAELLELRTVKADGRVFEPELHEHKQTISMPSLAPEDAIELEYLLHHAAGQALAESPEIFRHVFGSFSAPVLYSRFAVEIPASVKVRISTGVATASPLPSLHTERRDGMVIYRWEANDVAQSLQEPSMPAAANLPAVAVLPAYADWDEIRDHYRELAFEAAGAGTEVEAAVTALHPERAATEEELARRIVGYVQKNVAASDADAFASGDPPSAEDSLVNGEGSRTVAALALAHAAGLDVRLILARRANSNATAEISLRTFTKPLLGFAFHGKSGDRMVFADVETQGLAFGALPPEIATGDALSIPLAHPRAGSVLVALRVPPAGEENFADGDIRVTAPGDADARLDIPIGPRCAIFAARHGSSSMSRSRCASSPER